MKGTGPRKIEANWSPEMVEQWNKRWQDFWEWSDRAGVPVPLREAALRDMLSGIETMRTAYHLQQFIPGISK